MIGIALLVIALALLLIAWLRWEFRHAIPEEKLISTPTPIEEVSTESFIKCEKGGIITEDEIRHTAYLIASADNFTKSPETYWHEAEKSLKG